MICDAVNLDFFMNPPIRPGKFIISCVRGGGGYAVCEVCPSEDHTKRSTRRNRAFYGKVDTLRVIYGYERGGFGPIRVPANLGALVQPKSL